MSGPRTSHPLSDPQTVTRPGYAVLLARLRLHGERPTMSRRVAIMVPTPIQGAGKESSMLRLRRASLLVGLLACLLTPVSLAGAQTPVAEPTGGGWWTAWSSCDITPVRSGPTPPGIPGMADDILWLAGETTNDSDIEMIV